ncbi:hypothetical protein [Psilogramma increta granulovirus]|uniref:Uncharacterized protein n=1 Tax=Psilogramma increta granulovirus TaxID=2953508 RepID=A0A977XU77_9BBAC|nr:hypothetical protein [Psilogramma increta granulovirus]
MFVRNGRWNFNDDLLFQTACYICGEPWIGNNIDIHDNMWWCATTNNCRPVFCNQCVT